LCDSNSNCDSLTDGYPDTQRDTNSHSNGNSDDYGCGYCNSHSNSYSYRYGHCNGHGETNAYRKAQRNAKTTSHSAATPLRELAWRFWGAVAAATWFRRPRRNELPGASSLP
jgi:hypothetical protein